MPSTLGPVVPDALLRALSASLTTKTTLFFLYRPLSALAAFAACAKLTPLALFGAGTDLYGAVGTTRHRIRLSCFAFSFASTF